MTEKDKTGKELERRVADAYREMGAWKVEHDVELAGNQIDVYVELETPGRLVHRIAVEAKDWTSPVGIKIVNDFADIVNLLRRERIVDEGIIVSTTGFSKPARNAAQTYGIRLLEPTDLDAMVAKPKAAREKAEERPVRPLAQVTLLLDGISSFGTLERQYLVGVLAKALDLEQEQIRVLRVESGSVRVTLELPAGADEKLARMIESGQLDLVLVSRQIEAKKQERLEQLYAMVKQAYHHQDWQLVITVCQEIIGIAPHYRDVQWLLWKARSYSTRQRVRSIWAPYRIAIGMLAILLIVAGMVVSGRRLAMSVWPPTPQVSIEAFLITKGESPTAMVKPGTTITATVEEIVDIRTEASTTHQEKDLVFTWYTCRTGSKPVLQKIGNPQMLYIAPSEPGVDCICVVVEIGGVQLDRERIFVDVQK